MPKQKIDPSEGERRALVGYVPQYRLCAEVAYAAMIKGQLQWIGLLNSAAGQIDDFLIGGTGRIDAYQVKHGEKAETCTLNSLLSRPKGQDGAIGKSLFEQLHDGWKRLTAANPSENVHVHLVLRGIPTSIGAMPDLHEELPSESFQQFLREFWDKAKEVGSKWQAVADAIQKFCAIPDTEFEAFRTHCHLDFLPKVEPAALHPSTIDVDRENDIERLKAHLLSLASADSVQRKVEREALLRQLGWERRFRAAYPHEFRVDPRYQRIEETNHALRAAIDNFESGYVGLIGSPGSGKSTTLTETLRERGNFRLVSYYAFLPRDTHSSRGEAVNFLHDVVLQLRAHGFSGGRGSAPDSVLDLQNELDAQLNSASEEFRKSARKVVILVDGLDHIEREQSPERALVAVLPHPNSVPAGVIFMLGSQKKELANISQAILQQLASSGRTVHMQPLSRAAVHAFVQASNLSVAPTSQQTDRMFELSEGHPLALGLFVEALSKASTPSDFASSLDAAVPFSGNIENTYAVHWCKIEADDQLVRSFAFIARMRGTGDLNALSSVVGNDASKQLLKHGVPYLQFEGTSHCRFFHNSFRQFVLRKTEENALGAHEAKLGQAFHRELAAVAKKLPLSHPFAWEALYHAHSADDSADVLRIATPGFFRAQVMQLRNARAIFDDIKFAFVAARQLKQPLAAISAGLITREVERRLRALNEIDLPLFLLSLRGPDACLRQVVRGNSLAIKRVPALTLSGELLKRDHRSDAKLLFDLAEPIDLLTGNSALDVNRSGEASELTAWAAIAWQFRPVADVLNGVMKTILQVKARFTGRPEEETEADHRNEAIRELLTAMVEEAAWSKLDDALDFLREHEDFVQFSRMVDWQTCREHPASERSKPALQRLQAAGTSEWKSSAWLNLAVTTWRVLKDAAAVESVLKNVTPPQTPQEFGWQNTLGNFEQRLAYCRLMAIIGKPVSGEKEIPIPDNDERKQLLARIDRIVASIGTLWGRGIAGNSADVAEVRQLCASFMLFFDQRDSGQSHEWNTVQRRCPTVFEWLARAALASGFDRLAVVTDELRKRWTSGPPRWPWSTPNQRELALTLFELDKSNDPLRQTLVSVEASDDAADDPESRVQFWHDQSAAWSALGDKDAAERCFRRMLEATLGIRNSDEDDEARYWVEWFARQAQSSHADAEGDIRLLAAVICLLQKSRRGHLTDEALRKLGRVAGTISDDWGQQLWRWWLEQGATSWTESITGCLLNLLDAKRVPVEVVSVASRRLVVPWEDGTTGELPEAFCRAAYKERKGRELDSLLNSLIRTLVTRSFRRVRDVWVRAIASAANEVGRFPPKLPTFDEETDKPDNRPEPKLTLPDGSERPSSEVLATVTTVRSAVDLLKANYRGYPVREEQLAEMVWQRISTGDRESFAQDLAAEISEPRMLAKFSELLLASKCANHAKVLALKALQCTSGKGWVRRLDGGTALSASKALVSADPENGRGLVFARWLNDIIAGDAWISEMFDQFDELLPLFFGDIPHRDLWLLLRSHVVEFAEVRENAEQMPAFVVGPATPAIGASLMPWFETGCGLGNPDVEDECVRGLLELIQTRACDEAVNTVIAKWLTGQDQDQARALGVIHASMSFRDDVVQNYQQEIQQLRSANTFFLRDAATRIAQRLNYPRVEIPAKQLHPGYNFILPEIQDPKQKIPAGFYGPGRISPESEDPWEWVGIVEVELRILADATGIPLQNLVRRTAALMQELAPREQWNSDAERRMKERMEKFGLRLSWPRLRSLMASRAVACVLTELLDASKIELGLAYSLRSRLDPVDLMALQQEPAERPELIVLPTENEMDDFHSKEWLQNVGQALPKCIRRLPDGRIVLAELSEFRHWGRGNLEEVRMSCWTSPGYSPEAATVRHGLFSCDTWWRLDEYPQLSTQKIECLAIFFLPVFVRCGYLDFLAANPAICREMGWEIADVGKWVSGNDVMVETIWWCDGPRRRADVHNDEISGEGWIVAAHPSAAQALSEKFPSVVRQRSLRLANADPYGESGRKSSVNQTVELNAWMA